MFEAARNTAEPLAQHGPVNPSALMLVATLFMLREVEVSAIDITDVTFTEGSLSLRLPVSKVDWQAKGCTRAWHCVCDRQLPCPAHVLKEHMQHLQARFGDKVTPLFPTACGEICSKRSKAVDNAGGASKDADGSWRISDHTFRITGARTLCNWGLDPITIQLMGRWGSSAVLSYLAEAPLEGFHYRIGKPLNSSQELVSSPEKITEMDARVGAESLVKEHNQPVACQQKMQESLDSVSRQVTDLEHQLEGVAIVLANNRRRTEAWTVHNLLSSVKHRSLVDLATSPSEWRTMCGWNFSSKVHARTIREVKDPFSEHRLCPPDAGSADDASPSED